MKYDFKTFHLQLFEMYVATIGTHNAYIFHGYFYSPQTLKKFDLVAF